MVTVSDVVAPMERYAPAWLAESWDHVGLQLGDNRQEVHRMMVTLDVRPETVAEAVDAGVDLIYAHHPAMFHAVKTFDLSVPQNQMYATILQHGITVYAAHTNLDSTANGMNDWLCAQLGLKDVAVLIQPDASQQAHIKVEHRTGLYGLGRLGTLPRPLTAREFADYCEEHLNVPGLRLITPDHDKMISRVAVLGGSGAGFYQDALAQGADAYVTGDVGYHTAHDMVAAGLTVVDPGHHIEVVSATHMRQLFEKWNQENEWHIDVIQSKINTEPFEFIK